MAAEVYAAAWDVGGTISGEHGCGLARTAVPAAVRQYGDLAHAFRLPVKEAFDPFGILNPGKVVGDDPHAMTRHLRPMPGAKAKADPTEDDVAPVTKIALPMLEPALRWGYGDPWREASACNGCGACRSLEPTTRMCPAFRARRDEAASPRASRRQTSPADQPPARLISPRQRWGSRRRGCRRTPTSASTASLCRKECLLVDGVSEPS